MVSLCISCGNEKYEEFFPYTCFIAHLTFTADASQELKPKIHLKQNGSCKLNIFYTDDIFCELCNMVRLEQYDCRHHVIYLMPAQNTMKLSLNLVISKTFYI